MSNANRHATRKYATAFSTTTISPPTSGATTTKIDMPHYAHGETHSANVGYNLTKTISNVIIIANITLISISYLLTFSLPTIVILRCRSTRYVSGLIEAIARS